MMTQRMETVNDKIVDAAQFLFALADGQSALTLSSKELQKRLGKRIY
jgi:hypothetical protein